MIIINPKREVKRGERDIYIYIYIYVIIIKYKTKKKNNTLKTDLNSAFSRKIVLYIIFV